MTFVLSRRRRDAARTSRTGGTPATGDLCDLVQDQGGFHTPVTGDLCDLVQVREQGGASR